MSQSDNSESGIGNFTRRTESLEDYVRAVSHDLRSPLSIVSVQAQILQRCLAERELGPLAKRASDIVKTAERMNLMLNSLSDAIRAETGSFEMRKQPVDLTAMVKDVADRMLVLGDSRLFLSLPAGPVIVQADESRIERCVQNLISNALRYSAPPSPVDVRLSCEGGWARIDVEDRGPGISDEDLPHIFNRFYRGTAGIGTEGLGLGLYLCRVTAESHGGVVTVESVPGKGSVFTLYLPSD